ncbi:MAG: UDP-N-acetylglucosamine--N-acetylmuramyl-(pentapeptide) pyrophosphoryl-undecaprenol N-acetylglucosamine transferase, partial [Candidatus Neomarinimicrobiota bacterium]
ALALVDNGAAVLVHEAELTPDYLFETILTLIMDRDRLKAMGTKARELARPEATRDIVQHILDICEATCFVQ